MSAVLKFGGTSLINAGGFRAVANIIKNEHSPVVILSAIHNVTNQLNKLFYYSDMQNMDAINTCITDIGKKHNKIMDDLSIESKIKHEANHLLDNKLNSSTGLLHHIIKYPNHIETQYLKQNIMVTGEQISCLIMDNYLKLQNIHSQKVEGSKLFLCNHIINPYPCDISTLSIKRMISPIITKNNIPLIEGYYGRDRHDNIITFGRNGSDLTATFIADSLNINRVKIYKVEIDEMDAWKEGYVGVIDEEGNTISELLFDDAMTIAKSNRNVLSYSMLRPLINNRKIIIEIKNTMQPNLNGTKIIRK